MSTFTFDTLSTFAILLIIFTYVYLSLKAGLFMEYFHSVVLVLLLK